MMMINADTIVHWQSYDDEHESFPEHTGTIAEFLDAMTDEGCPKTVDATQVVRCKDCEYWDRVTANRGGCKDLYGFGRWWKPDDHCSYGVRRDGEQE